MTVETLLSAVIDACEAEGVEYMVTGAFAYSYYGIPRSTKDADVVLDVQNWSFGHSHHGTTGYSRGI